MKEDRASLAGLAFELFLVTLLFFVVFVIGYARKAESQWTYTYLQTSVSINSATVPVSVIPAVPKSSYCVKVLAAAANPIYCFAYGGSGPALGSSAPANCQSTGTGAGCWEVSVGNPLCDAVNQTENTTNQQNGPFAQGIACEFQTSGSSVTAEGIYR